MGIMWNALAEKARNAQVDQFGWFVGTMVFFILVFLFVVTLTITLALYYNH